MSDNQKKRRLDELNRFYEEMMLVTRLENTLKKLKEKDGDKVTEKSSGQLAAVVPEGAASNACKCENVEMTQVKQEMPIKKEADDNDPTNSRSGIEARPFLFARDRELLQRMANINERLDRVTATLALREKTQKMAKKRERDQSDDN